MQSTAFHVDESILSEGANDMPTIFYICTLSQISLLRLGKEIMESKKTDLMTINTVADKIGCHANQVRLWLDTGILRAIKIGKCQMISLEELERFIDRFYGYDVSNFDRIRESLEKIAETEREALYVK